MAEAPDLPKAYAYLRVSTRKQDVENQRLQITRYAQTHALKVADEEWFLDDATSGTMSPMKRAGFRDMMETLDAMKAVGEPLPKCVLVYEISRLGRNLWEVLDAIKAIEGFSMLVSTSPKESFLNIEDRSIRNLLLLVISWAAERERELLVQRTLEGVAKAKELNRHAGNVPLGYTLHKCEVGVCITPDRKECDKRGRLFLTEDGRRVYDMLLRNPKLKPRNLKGMTSAKNDYQRFALIRNVRKFGSPAGAQA